MANTVNRLKIMDGPSHVTLHVYLQSDGASGELVNYVILDPDDDLIPNMPKRQNLIVKQIWYETGGFNITFAFNSINPWPFWTLTPGASLHHDWRFFGGIRDYSGMPLMANSYQPSIGWQTAVPQSAPSPMTGGLTSDGKLLITTSGFVDAKDSASFVLWMEKRDRANPQPD
jgi:hypothetical protein